MAENRTRTKLDRNMRPMEMYLIQECFFTVIMIRERGEADTVAESGKYIF